MTKKFSAVKTTEINVNGMNSGDKMEIKEILQSLTAIYDRPRSIANTCRQFLPILQWLPKYSLKRDLFKDFIAGITLAVFHVPQGIAYAAMIGGTPLVNGLYTSIFLPFFYLFFGTSIHASTGGNSIVAMMTSQLVLSVRDKHLGPFASFTNGTKIDWSTATAMKPLERHQRYADVSATILFSIGIAHLLMAVFRLDFLMSYLSDELVAGFSLGTAFHVVVAQLPDLLDLHGLPRRTGIGNIFLKLYDLFSKLEQANIATCLVSLCSTVFLILGREVLLPAISRKFHRNIPIPFELLLVIFATLFSWQFQLHELYNVSIVGNLPSAIPLPQLPKFDYLPLVAVDSLGIAVVIVASHITTAKMIADKHGYKIDAGQELFALGCSQVLSSFFPVFPGCAGIGRSFIASQLDARSQLSTLWSCGFLLCIILFLGPYISPLPMCTLAVIILLVLKSIFYKFGDLPKLLRTSKFDAAIFIVSCAATIIFDVVLGLAISLVLAIFTTTLRLQWANSTITTIDAQSPTIRMLRFEAPLLFVNVERFLKEFTKIMDGFNGVILLDFTLITAVDMAGLKAIKQVINEAAKTGCIILFVGITPTVLLTIGKCSDLKNFIKINTIFPTLSDAINHAQNEIGDLSEKPEGITLRF